MYANPFFWELKVLPKVVDQRLCGSLLLPSRELCCNRIIEFSNSRRHYLSPKNSNNSINWASFTFVSAQHCIYRCWQLVRLNAQADGSVDGAVCDMHLQNSASSVSAGELMLFIEDFCVALMDLSASPALIASLSHISAANTAEPCQ